MVWDRPENELTAFDWKVIGSVTPCPRKRIDVPLPYSTGGIHELKAIFTSFVLELDEIAKQPVKVRSKIFQVRELYERTQLACREKQLAWREELREPAERLKVVR